MAQRTKTVVRSLVLLCSMVGLLGLAIRHGAAEAVQSPGFTEDALKAHAAKTVGPKDTGGKSCSECHSQEVEAWEQTRLGGIREV